MPREPSYRLPFDPSLRSLGSQRPITDQPPTALSIRPLSSTPHEADMLSSPMVKTITLETLAEQLAKMSTRMEKRFGSLDRRSTP